MKEVELSGVTRGRPDGLDRPGEELSGPERWHLDILSEHMPAIVWTTDGDLRFTSSAGGGLSSLGHAPGEVVGQSIHQYFGTEDISFPPIAAHLRALEGEAVTYELEWHGRTFLSHVQPLRSPEGMETGVIGAALDITARKEMEEEVREAEARYHALVEHVPAVMYVAAADGDRSPIYVSPQIERILGCSPAAWKANPRSWADRIHPADRDRVLLEVALCQQLDDALSVEYRLADGDGGDVWVHDEAVLLRDPVGNPSQWQGVLVVVGHRAEARAVAGLRRLLEEAQDDEGGAPWSP